MSKTGGDSTSDQNRCTYLWYRCSTNFDRRDKGKTRPLFEQNPAKYLNELNELLNKRFLQPRTGQTAFVLKILGILKDGKFEGEDGFVISDKRPILECLETWSKQTCQEHGIDPDSELMQVLEVHSSWHEEQMAATKKARKQSSDNHSITHNGINAILARLGAAVEEEKKEADVVMADVEEKPEKKEAAAKEAAAKEAAVKEAEEQFAKEAAEAEAKAAKEAEEAVAKEAAEAEEEKSSEDPEEEAEEEVKVYTRLRWNSGTGMGAQLQHAEDHIKKLEAKNAELEMELAALRSDGLCKKTMPSVDSNSTEVENCTKSDVVLAYRKN